MKKHNQKGIGAIEALLILVIVGLIGFVGWYVWHSKNQANNTYAGICQIGVDSPCNAPQYQTIKTFDDCKKATGSKTLETYPETCVTRDGKYYYSTNYDFTTVKNGYLVISDWGVRLKVASDMSDFKVEKPQTSGYSKTDQYTNIVAPSLDANWKCVPNHGYKGSIGSIYKTDQAKRAGPYEPLATKKIGNFTYSFEIGGSNCTTDPLFQHYVDEFKQQFILLESF